MYRQIIEYCSELSCAKILAFGLILGLAIELFTIWARFGLGMQAARVTAPMGAWTFGIRLHHGYLGIAIGLIGWFVAAGNLGLRNLLLMLCVGIIASDLMHHFLVLWIVTGSPQFDLFYRKE